MALFFNNFINYLKNRNVKRFLLFFVLAFICLIFSKLSSTYKTKLQLKVNLQNLEEEVILQPNALSKSINAYVEAKGFALLPLMFTNSKTIILDAKTDLSRVSNTYIFEVEKHRFLIEDQLGSAYRLLNIKPDTLFLEYSKMASKFVPLVLDYDFSYALGFDLKDEITLSSDSVKVVGSKSEIDGINFVSTTKIQHKNLSKNISQTINLLIPKSLGVAVFPETVSLNATIVRFTEGSLKVPVTITNLPDSERINYFPKLVTVSYYVDLENYKNVKPSDFMVVCDYSEINNSQRYLIPKIVNQPKYIKRASLKQKQIDYIKL